LSVVLLLTIACGGHAYFLFSNSVLIDESDVVGKDTFDVPMLCNGTCRVYVSLPKSSEKLALGLSIGMFKHFLMNFVTLSTWKRNGNEKGYWFVWQKEAQLTVYNKNKHHEAAPFLLWIVQADDDVPVQVYDVNFFKDFTLLTPDQQTITVMSTEGFSLSTNTSGKMTMTVTASGFDTVLLGGSDNCENALEQQDPSTYQDLNLWFNGPLLTLVFDRETYNSSGIGISVNVEEAYEFSLDTPTFITSPGYISCESQDPNSARTFHSSLYEVPTKYELYSESIIHIYEGATFNVDDAKLSLFYVDEWGTYELRFHGNLHDPLFELRTSNVNITWDPTGAGEKESYLIRLYPILQLDTTTVELPEFTTTHDPDVPPVKTTTVEIPGVTTTHEPDVPPVKTTTVE
ncbi:hypothetical protein PMAYCL1PPCAC_21611, partial [Pristionchus mayeri]